jgi:hypothetical protein
MAVERVRAGAWRLSSRGGERAFGLAAQAVHGIRMGGTAQVGVNGRD